MVESSILALDAMALEKEMEPSILISKVVAPKVEILGQEDDVVLCRTLRF